jgi:ATP-dependent helicase/nuclease subunit A
MSVITVAGAGTGKTHALVERYLWALLGLDGAEPRGPDRLLAITFTDKAAHEMRARLERRLGDVRFAPERETAIVERAQARGRVLENRALENLRRSLSGAPIYTFHAWCAKLLRDHALAAGLDPAFVVLEPDDEQRLLAETAEACVIDALQGGGGASLVAELVARVQLHGFGERKGLVECLVDLHGTLAERGLDASALPLAPASADVESALGNVAACAAALRPLVAGQGSARIIAVEEHCAALASIHMDPRIDDPEAALSRTFRALRDHVGGNWGGPKVAGERRALVAAVDVLGAALVDDMTKDLAPAVRSLLAELDVRQRREKHARGFLAFGDLLRGARDLLRGSASVRARVSERFARVFVDEYQDTSPVQEEILALINGAGNATAQPEGAPARLFVVGDPKQSIYGFRGADARIFTRALEGAAREELTQSRRSTVPVVALANLVATHALARGAFGVERTQLVPLTSSRGGAGPAGEHWLVGPRPGDAPPLTLHELESLVVARRLRELIDGGCRPDDVAILVRRGKAAVPLARALGRAGVPALVVGGDGFFVRPEVADVIAALTLATDPTDELAVLTVLRSPLICAPDDAVLALYEALPQRRGLTWPGVVEHVAGVVLRSTHEAFAGLLDRVCAFDAVLATVTKRLHHEPLGRAVDALLDDGQYAAACAIEPDGALRLRNLDKLRHLATRGGRSGRGESALVAVARLASALDDPPSEPQAPSAAAPPEGGSERGVVRIMTIHQAKGLEFPVVVLADAGSGLKGESDDVAFDAGLGLAVTARGRPIAACAQPSSRGARAFAPTAIQGVRRRLRDRNEGELARLLYVALTRARDRLFVVGSPRRQGPGSLLGILEIVRAADTAALDALLPRVEVEASLVGLAPGLASAAHANISGRDDGEGGERPRPAAYACCDQPLRAGGLAPFSARAPAPALELLAPVNEAPQRPRMRVRASELGGRLEAQTAMGFMEREAPELDDEERLPPRAAGRLAHALVALVATEGRSALADPALLDARLRRAARACGAVDVPAELVARCARTLGGPVRRLVDAGFALSFEESLWLELDDVVIEGKADLVARTDERTVVVELKLTAERARGERAQLQVAAYAAALDRRGEPAVALTTWALGDADPPDAQKFGKAQRARLEQALARLTTTT